MRQMPARIVGDRVEKADAGDAGCSREHPDHRDEVRVPPAPFGIDIRRPLGYFGPNQPGTSQEVFLAACNSFVYKHLQWRRGESNPRPATDPDEPLRA